MGTCRPPPLSLCPPPSPTSWPSSQAQAAGVISVGRGRTDAKGLSHVSEHKDPARVDGRTESERKRQRDKQINGDNTRDGLEKQSKTE